MASAAYPNQRLSDLGLHSIPWHLAFGALQRIHMKYQVLFSLRNNEGIFHPREGQKVAA